jgi:Ca2+-transporting ATPase
MTTLHRTIGHESLLLIKGAPEQVLPRCREVSSTTDGHGRAFEAARAMARSGLRVIAFAQRFMPGAAASGVHERDEAGFDLLGLVGLLDAPRAEAQASVAECHAAGIRVVMVTGDHPQTAGAVAGLVGIPVPGTTSTVTGVELDAMDDETLRARADEIAVIARVSPEHKLRIVRSLQQRGEIVAMTGDGVNDAPALRQADIGVAMGRAGTDVAREAADMVLVDDNFATIVAATREGRRIYDNIRRFIRYVLTGNSAEIWVLFLAPIVGLPLPLLPIHILWVNLITDGLPGLALALERTEPDAMRRPPRPPDESVFAHGVWQHALWVGLLMGGVVLVAQGWALHMESAQWRTITFSVLALSQLGHALAVRSERQSLIRQGLWSNPALALIVVGTVGLQLLILYVPAFNAVFQTQPLTGVELLVVGAFSTVVLIAVEAEKWLLRTGWLQYRASGKTAFV